MGVVAAHAGGSISPLVAAVLVGVTIVLAVAQAVLLWRSFR
jgi:hypothetical protein